VTTLADIVRRYRPAYRAEYADHILPSHERALTAIAQCRTAALGGHVYTCSQCGGTRYRYHSCRNRHCPLCQQRDGEQWLAQQQALLPPVPYFLITFTLPAELRAVAYRHQRQFYTLFFRASASALQQLAADPRFVGGQLGMLGCSRLGRATCATIHISTIWCRRLGWRRMGASVARATQRFWCQCRH
jgi:Transposase zinc-binding domain